ncbi:hypothetical protein FWK35_00033208 [Aphis craccivora]|uniref:Uncharacterized protein n=1 Tax=Aphis craccivora TaxID=307492 RepID=A0A6G0VP33_APHCR|nr:hypothetical protein FWK35_00033208 [Aphis craccivora]
MCVTWYVVYTRYMFVTWYVVSTWKAIIQVCGCNQVFYTKYAVDSSYVIYTRYVYNLVCSLNLIYVCNLVCGLNMVTYLYHFYFIILILFYNLI